MNEAEKEQLIKKDIVSIENRVRHAFNQGYEMGLKENKSENPTGCGDAISREAAIKAIEALQRPIMREESNYYQFKFSGMSEALGAVENLPSVTPQPRTGRWIKQNYGWNWQCSECGFVTPPSAKEIFTFCPQCGCKMEVIA